jgi:RNA polymerase sigma factor (sigma-70 family)
LRARKPSKPHCVTSLSITILREGILFHSSSIETPGLESMYKREYVTTQAPEMSDSALIAQALAGDDHTFECLVNRYRSPLYNFIGRCLKDYEQAGDVLQFVFMQLYISLPKLHMNLSSTRTKTPLKSWLFQVAWNRCMDELRKQRPLLFSELESGNDEEELSLVNTIPDGYPLPEEIAERHDLQLVLRQAIGALPPKFRSVVFLRYSRELSYVEIGRVLNMPENTVKTYFQRARPLLRAKLAAHGQVAVHT